MENHQAGASADATKVVVLITDGDPTDSDGNGIVKRYDDKNIIRFVIGVSCASINDPNSGTSFHSAKTQAHVVPHASTLTTVSL